MTETSGAADSGLVATWQYLGHDFAQPHNECGFAVFLFRNLPSLKAVLPMPFFGQSRDSHDLLLDCAHTIVAEGNSKILGIHTYFLGHQWNESCVHTLNDRASLPVRTAGMNDVRAARYQVIELRAICLYPAARMNVR